MHFKVAREFVERVQAQCAGQEVLKGVTPGQQIVKIIHDELVSLLGEGATGAEPGAPAQGDAGRPARLGQDDLGRQARPAAQEARLPAATLVAGDVQRPAAIDQLEILARQEELGFYADRASKDVPAIGAAALAAAAEAGADAMIFDTAGRLQIDQELVEEVRRLRARVDARRGAARRRRRAGPGGGQRRQGLPRGARSSPAWS